MGVIVLHQHDDSLPAATAGFRFLYSSGEVHPGGNTVGMVVAGVRELAVESRPSGREEVHRCLWRDAY